MALAWWPVSSLDPTFILYTRDYMAVVEIAFTPFCLPIYWFHSKMVPGYFQSSLTSQPSKLTPVKSIWLFTFSPENKGPRQTWDASISIATRWQTDRTPVQDVRLALSFCAIKEIWRPNRGQRIAPRAWRKRSKSTLDLPAVASARLTATPHGRRLLGCARSWEVQCDNSVKCKLDTVSQFGWKSLKVASRNKVTK